MPELFNRIFLRLVQGLGFPPRNALKDLVTYIKSRRVPITGYTRMMNVQYFIGIQNSVCREDTVNSWPVCLSMTTRSADGEFATRIAFAAVAGTAIAK
jgi:hypothetical protein